MPSDGDARRATVRTDHGTAARAERVAAAIRPDNTESMRTTVEASAVRTEIRRETTGGLQATVDDYVVNLGVAEAVLEAVDADADEQNERTTDTTDTH